MSMINLLVLFGGKSSEHDVSVNSARNVVGAIDKARYNVTLVSITKAGEWRMVDDVREADDDYIAVSLDLARGCFVAGGNELAIDVAFPVLHGKFGEDGTVQGLLDIAGVPYVGCGTEASALCMDKIRTKRLLAQAGTPVTRDAVAATTNIQGLANDLPAPWFVKPSRAGSSVGVTKVKNAADLEAAVALALQHDSEVLIEAAVPGARELEVAVMGNAPHVITSGVGEIIPGEEFYSYEDKYADSSTSQVVTDADLPDDMKARVTAMARRVYETLYCRGLARVDFLLSDSGDLYVNEVNTMPGFTNISMFPKLMAGAGYSYPQLIDKLIALALQ